MRNINFKYYYYIIIKLRKHVGTVLFTLSIYAKFAIKFETKFVNELGKQMKKLDNL